MPIENRSLEAGTRLVVDYKKQSYVCTVEAGEEGKLAFVLDGKRYTSPSAAGSAVMGGTACNGWRFWTVEGQATANPARAEKPTKVAANAKAPKAEKAAKPKAERKPRKKAFKLFERIPGDADGKFAFWCHGCQDDFLAETEQPEVCPEGHRHDDPELTGAPAAEVVQAERESAAVGA